MHLYFHDLAIYIVFACLLVVTSRQARPLVGPCPVALRPHRRQR